MAKNSIWITKKQLRNRVLFFVVSVVIILILLALIFNKMGPGVETTEEAPTSEEQNLEVAVDQEAEDSVDEAIEEPPEAGCTMMRKHAEDELLDAYKIEKEAKENIERLEGDLGNANEKMDEAEVFIKQAKEMLEDAKLCSE